MTVQAERLPNEPIIILRYSPPFDPQHDLRAVTQHTAEAITETEGTLYRIEDLTQIKIDFSQIVAAMAEATTDSPGSMRDPRMIPALVSQQAEMFTIVTDAMQQEQYGMRDVALFSTVQDALAHAREQIAAQT